MPTLTQQELTELLALIPGDFESYTKQDAIDYYTYLSNKGFSYGDLALQIVEGNSTRSVFVGNFATVSGAQQGVSFEVDGDNWNRVRYELLLEDWAARDTNSGSDLSVAQYLTIHTTAYDAVGLAPETFMPHTPLTLLAETDPSGAQEMWNDLVIQGGVMDNMFTEGLRMTIRSGVNLNQGLADIMADSAASMRWYGNTAKALLDTALSEGSEALEDIFSPTEFPEFWDDFDDLQDFADDLSTDIGDWLDNLLDTPDPGTDLPGSAGDGEGEGDGSGSEEGEGDGTGEDASDDGGAGGEGADAGSEDGNGDGASTGENDTDGGGMTDAEDDGSPLVIDLDKDSYIELISYANSTALFDVDQDGMAERTGWVASDDGLLVYDVNEDGIINDNGELFGTRLTDGFSILAAHDSNDDDVIDASDTIWTDLQIWQDDDEDGYSRPDELHTLDEFGIVSISLDATRVDDEVEGNRITHESTVTYDDQSTGLIVDAWFDYNNTITTIAGDYTIDVRTLFLPTLRGFGNLVDLHIAMSQDGDLLDDMMTFVDRDPEDFFTDHASVASEFTQILYGWAGVNPALAFNARGQYLEDAKHLEFLEEFYGREFLQRGWDPDPRWDAAQKLEHSWDQLLGVMKAQVIIQAGGDELFDGDLTYSLNKGLLLGDVSMSQSGITAMKDLALSLDAGDREAFWVNIADFIRWTRGNVTDGTERGWLDGAIDDSNVPGGITDWDDIEEQLYPAGGQELDGDSGNNTITGGSGHDTLDGKAGNDDLDGGTGNDYLIGGDGNDILDGGVGADTLHGGDDDDIYHYSDGDDAIRDTDGNDKIVLAAGITSGDISFLRAGNDNDLMITVDGVGTIIIENHYLYYSNDYRVETLEFSDTSTIDLTALDNVEAEGSYLNDFFHGVDDSGNGVDIIHTYAGNDIVFGEDGDDVIYGGDDHDQLEGDAGADTLYGENGNDLLKGDDGNDILVGAAGNDEIWGGDGDDDIDGGDGRDELRGENNDDDIDGGADNDEIYGGSGDDDIYGGTGDDEIHGGADDDYIEGNDGDDWIDASAGVDTIYGGDGDDYIETGTGVSGYTEYAYGGNDNDTIIGDVQTQHLYGEAGDDTLSGGNGDDELYGGNDNDRLYGGLNADLLDGGSGDDVLDGEDGADTLEGGTGSDIYIFESNDDGDTIEDTDGTADIIHFGTDITPDLLTMSVVNTYDLEIDIDSGVVDQINIIDQFDTGDTKQIERVRFNDSSEHSELDLLRYGDWTFGSGSADTVYLNNGVDDIYIGLGGNDILYGYSGNDVLLGGDGNDKLYGQGDNDELYGGDGNDSLFGDTGDDIMVGGYGGDSFVDVYGNNTFYDVEKIDGAIADPSNDGPGNESMKGGSGNDTFIAQAQTNTLKGYAGNDVYKIYLHSDGTKSTNYITNETEGDDKLYITDIDFYSPDWYFGYSVGSPGYLTIYSTATDGENRIIIYDQHSGYDGGGNALFAIDEITFKNNVTFDFTDFVTVLGTSATETLNGSAAKDYIFTSGGGDTVYAGAEADYVRGGDGVDTLYGESGDDFLFGYTGNDEIHGGDGADRINGEDGNDTIYGDDGDDTLWGGGGTNVLYGGDGNDVINVDGSGDEAYGDEGDDQVTGGNGNDTLYGDGDGSEMYAGGSDNVTGGNGNDTLYGGGGIDFLSGGYDDDVLYGGDGNDKLYGERLNNTSWSGNDTLYGGDGNDVIQGNNGDDVLYGQDGADIMNGNAGADTFVFEAATAFNNSDTIGDFDTTESDVIDIADVLDGYFTQGVDDVTDFVQITDNGSHSFLAVDQDGGADNFVQIAQLSNVTGLTDEAALVTSGNLVVA